MERGKGRYTLREKGEACQSVARQVEGLQVWQLAISAP